MQEAGAIRPCFFGAPEGPCTHGGRCPPFLHGLAHPPCPPSPRGRGGLVEGAAHPQPARGRADAVPEPHRTSRHRPPFFGAPEGPCTHGGRCPPFLHGLAPSPLPPFPTGKGGLVEGAAHPQPARGRAGAVPTGRAVPEPHRTSRPRTPWARRTLAFFTENPPNLSFL